MLYVNASVVAGSRNRRVAMMLRHHPYSNPHTRLIAERRLLPACVRVATLDNRKEVVMELILIPLGIIALMFLRYVSNLAE